MNYVTYAPILLALGLLGGCAPKIPLELARARAAYDDARSGPAASLVPAELHKAHQALNEAEAAFKEDPKGYHTRDLAYVAQRKSQLAEVLAAQAADSRSTAASNAQYQSTQDAIMKDTRAQLGETRSDLAASQTATAQSQAQLAASEAARAQAEQRADEAMAALAQLAAVKNERRGLVITLSGSVLFRSDEAMLMPEATSRLGQVTDALLTTRDRTILVEGHCDSQGADAYNLELSQRRAAAVRDFLVQRGYDASRVRAVGIGEARPVGDNDTAEGRANNRRVEIIVEPLVASNQ